MGLEPSIGTGLVEVLNDPDKNGVFKITSRDAQKFVVKATNEHTTVSKYYNLNDLVFQETPPTPPSDPGPIRVKSMGTYFTPTGSVEMLMGGNDITMGTYEQVTEGGETVEQYTGTSGTITNVNNYAVFRWAGEIPENSASAIVMMNNNVQAKVGSVSSDMAFSIDITDFDSTGTVNGTITFYSDSYETEISTVNFAFVNANVTQA